MQEKAILVLGANAFSGQDFIDLLLENGAKRVVGVSRSPEKGPLFLKYKERKNAPGQYLFRQIDMNRQMDELLALFAQEKPAWIVNFAAQSEVGPSWEHPEHWYQTNCVALAEMVNYLRRQDYLERYLHVSSPEVYGSCSGKVTEKAPFNPSTPYAASKAAADTLLFTYHKQFAFPLLMVRSTNVYGPRQQLFKIIPRSAVYLQLGRKIQLHGGGKAVKSYIHIRDISQGELAILAKGRLGEIYHLSPDHGIAVRDVVATICAKLGHDFAAMTEIVSERPGQDAAYVIDSAKARSELGWLPLISMDEGISQVVDWVRANWAEIKLQPLEYLHKA